MTPAGKLNISFGGAFGSEGKGLWDSFIGWFEHIDISVSNGAPNSGHTFYLNGKKEVVQQLPVSALFGKHTMIYLCAGAVINPVTLLREIEHFDIDSDRVCIHPRAAIIEPQDVDNERPGSSVSKIASTGKGVGAALIRKINREAKLAKDIPELQEYIRELDLEWYMDQGCTVLMEISQGLDLSINSGLSYPYCTSREVTVPAALSDAQVHPKYLGKVSVCIRTYPIRVGNTEIGNSGPFYSDSEELTWKALGLTPEITTNTKRVRRVATFSHKQYEHMIKVLKPDQVLLNFANYMKPRELKHLLSKLPEVTHVGFGPHIEDVESVFR